MDTLHIKYWSCTLTKLPSVGLLKARLNPSPTLPTTVQHAAFNCPFNRLFPTARSTCCLQVPTAHLTTIGRSTSHNILPRGSISPLVSPLVNR